MVISRSLVVIWLTDSRLSEAKVQPLIGSLSTKSTADNGGRAVILLKRGQGAPSDWPLISKMGNQQSPELGDFAKAAPKNLPMIGSISTR